MKLGLLGFPITHSLSPSLYGELLGSKLTSYELFSFERPDLIPALSVFSSKLDGLNITSPYKEHFFSSVIIESEIVKSFGAINTIGFVNGKAFATNTDLLAVRTILERYLDEYPGLHIILLGDGVMARLTRLVCHEKKIAVTQLSRKNNPGLEFVDLRSYSRIHQQALIINACSREFVFQGETCGTEIFWDYNYSFLPHQNTLPMKVKSYLDGQEMLLLQAKEAINFWFQHNPKLK